MPWAKPPLPIGIPYGEMWLSKKFNSIATSLNNLVFLSDSPYFPLYLIERDFMSKLFKLLYLLSYFLDSHIFRHLNQTQV